MPRNMSLAAVAAAVVLASASHAAEVYYSSGLVSGTGPSAGTRTELLARGFNGFLPIAAIDAPLGSGVTGFRSAITATPTTLYGLEGSPVGANADLYAYPIQGLPPGSPPPPRIRLSTGQTDIVAHGNQLLGVSNSGSTLNINSISIAGTTGTVSPLLSIPGVSASSYTASISNGKLYLLGAGSFGSTPNFHIVNLATLTLERQAVIAPLSGFGTSTPAELASTPDGSKLLVRYSNSSMQIDTTTLATSAIPGPAETNPFAIAQKMSDGVVLAYNGPALAHASATYTGITANALYRKPQTLSGSATISLLNGLATDGTTPTNVRSDQLLTVYAPAGVTTSVTAQPLAGDFSARDLGTARYLINLAGPQRGLVTLDQANIVSDQGPVQIVRSTPLSFAYEPISSNLIGNGDFDIGPDRYYGWTFIGGNSSASVAGNRFLSLPAYSGTSGLSFYQDLELGLPDDQLILSFDILNIGGFSSDAGTGSLRFLLDGQVVYQTPITVNQPASSISAIVTVPPTVDWDNPRLSIDFRRTSGSTSSILNAYIDNLSLVAIPEPSLTAALLAPAVLLRRRPARCCR